MNKKLKFQLNRAGVRELMRSEEMQKILEGFASDIRARCGEDFEQDLRVGKNRANAMVYTNTIRGKRRNLRDNTLLKALK